MIRKYFLLFILSYSSIFSMDDPNYVQPRTASEPDLLIFDAKHTGIISPKPPSPLPLPSPRTPTNLQNDDQLSQSILTLQQEVAQNFNLKDTAHKLIKNQITQFTQKITLATHFIDLYPTKLELTQNIASIKDRIHDIHREIKHYIHTNHISHETVNALLKNPEKSLELVTQRKLTPEQACQLLSYDVQHYQENCNLEREIKCLESVEQRINEFRNTEIVIFEREFQVLDLEKQLAEVAVLKIERDNNIPEGILRWASQVNKGQSELTLLEKSWWKTANIKRKIEYLNNNIKTWKSQSTWEQEKLLRTNEKIKIAYKIGEEQKQKYREHLSQQIQTQGPNIRVCLMYADERYKGPPEGILLNPRLPSLSLNEIAHYVWIKRDPKKFPRAHWYQYTYDGSKSVNITAIPYRAGIAFIEERIAGQPLRHSAVLPRPGAPSLGLTVMPETRAAEPIRREVDQQLIAIMNSLNSLQNNCSTEEIQQARLTTVKRALQEQGQQHELHFQFTPQVQQTLTELNIPVEKYQHIKGDALQIQGAQETIQTINTAVELRENFIGKDETIVASCDASIHFADAGFDMIMTGHVQEGFACNDFSHGILDYAVQKAGLVGIGIAKGVGKGLIRIVTTPIEMACEGDIVGVTIYFGPAPLRACYNLYTLVHALVSTLATEERRASFYNECQQFLELPLEKQAEHISEFLTVLIGPSKIRKIPALQSGIKSIGKLSSATVREFKNFLKPYYLGIAIRTKVELTELVTFGDRIMSSEFKGKIIAWGKANEWALSDADLVRRAEKCMPFSYACTRAANDFIIGKNILFWFKSSNIKQVLDKGEKIDDRIEAMIDENTKIIFRKDFGSKAHSIKSHGYHKPVDHYNIEIQTKRISGSIPRFDPSKLSYHIVVDDSGKVVDFF